MTDPKNARESLRAFKKAMIDDIMEVSDEDILAEFVEDIGSPAENAKRMRALFQHTVLLANKSRLKEAQAGAAASRSVTAKAPIQIAEARARLRQVLDAHANDKNFTLAARKESELSDADVLDMLEVMQELGLLK
jgi:hypothetical protein